MRSTAVLILSTTLLVACGGGGSSDPPVGQVPTPIPPPAPSPPPPSPPIGFGTPVAAQIAGGDQAISVGWYSVENAKSYNIYYATESGVSPQNYLTLTGGTKLNVLSTPQTISQLVNDVPVYVVITAVADEFESAPTGQMVVSPQVPISPRQGTGKLADTGVDGCADEDKIRITCPVAGYEGQDGELGRDAEAQSLAKVGAGDAGFDFTKLDTDGAPLAASAASWSCVHDNFTELTWEVKTRDGGLRDLMNGYTWYEPDGRRNGGDQGAEDNGICSVGACDTFHYIQAINALQLCGHDDWRLPTRMELLSITNYGRRSPAVDFNYFSDVPPAQYAGHTWSSSSTPSVILPGRLVWTVDFVSGHVQIKNKREAARVRLVRGDPRGGS